MFLQMIGLDPHIDPFTATASERQCSPLYFKCFNIYKNKTKKQQKNGLIYQLWDKI